MSENNNNNQAKYYAIASLVLGIASIATSAFYVGIACAIIGLILGIKANQQEKQVMATAGIILSIIGLAAVIAFFIACTALGSIAGCAYLAYL